MAGPRTIGRAPIPGDSDQPDVDVFCLVEGHMGQPHECGDAAKAWHDKTGGRLIEFFQGTVLSFSF
jgi:hypothetical protein